MLAIVYNTPGCHKCKLTADRLKKSMEVKEIPIDEDIKEYMQRHDMLSAPLVRIYNDYEQLDEWHDFDAERVQHWTHEDD